MRTFLYDIYAAAGRTGDMLVFKNQSPHILKNNGSIGSVLTSNGLNAFPTWEPTSPDFITAIADTSQIDLDVTAGVLTANFVSNNISQFTNDVPYLTTTGITPAALTKVDDTNVTLTLGGTPSTALLQATSLTLGWTGVLSYTRGGTDGWVDYSATSTIVGWSSFTTKEISYTRVGTNTLIVRFLLTGTSNSTSTTFTLPVTSVGAHISLIRATDNSLAATVGFVACSTSNTVTAFSTVAAPSWTAINIKSIGGIITIQY